MSDIIISSVKTRKELKQFARFGYELYKGNPYAVPDLLEDTLDTFDPQRNPVPMRHGIQSMYVLDGLTSLMILR